MRAPILIIFCVMLFAGCARKPVTIKVPAGAGSQWSEAADTINFSVGILKQLEDHPNGIDIVVDRDNGASGQTQQKAF